MQLGGARFAWQSDHAQIYVADGRDPFFNGIDQLGPEVFAKGFHIFPNGIAVYTKDCLRQEIEVAFHDAKPEAVAKEWRSEDAWTKTAEVAVSFPSGGFLLSSPSKSGGEAYLPVLKTPATHLILRLYWLEYEEGSYEPLRPKPDVIRLEFWPA
jgi:hypothetical protein